MTWVPISLWAEHRQMARRKRKRSQRVDLRHMNLKQLGAASAVSLTLGGCADQTTFQRNVYAETINCQSDYRDTQCTPGMIGQTLGPVYRIRAGRPSPCVSTDPGPGISLMASGVLAPSSPIVLRTERVKKGAPGTSCPPTRRTSNSGVGSSMAHWMWGSGASRNATTGQQRPGVQATTRTSTSSTSTSATSISRGGFGGTGSSSGG